MTIHLRPSTVTLTALLASNVLVGVLAVLFLAQVDRHYSELVQTSLPLLNDVRSVAWEVTVMQRSINRYPHRPPVEQQQLFSRAEAARQRADVTLAQLRRRPLPPGSDATFAELARIQAELDGFARQWRLQVRAGDVAAADALNLGSIQPAYGSYSTVVEELARQVERHGASQSAAYSADASRFRSILLGVATWPIWVGVLLIVLVGGVFAGLAPLLRRLDG
jgi:hypothetical protein